MKKILLCAAFIMGTTAAFAQCDKQLVLSSSKTEYLDANKNLVRTTDEITTIDVGTTTVVIAPGNEPQKMTMNIATHTCNWTVPYKEGKSVIKGTLSDPSGNGGTKNLTLTIEGKDGKLSLLAELDEMPDQKIRVTIDKFEEKK